MFASVAEYYGWGPDALDAARIEDVFWWNAAAVEAEKARRPSE